MQETTTKLPARTPYIDVARGIALILVVWGHILSGSTFTFQWIFSFHMPIFFFLSGMCFHPEKFDTLGDFLKKKVKTRILPYFVIALLGFLICMCIPSYREPVLSDGLGLQMLSLVYYAQPRNLYIGQSWFLIGLFFAELFAFFWYRFTKDKKLTFIFFGLGIWILLASQVLWRINNLFTSSYFSRLPWKIDAGFIAGIFVVAGYYTQKYQLLNKLFRFKFMLFPLLLFFNILFGPILNGYVNICDCVMGIRTFYFISAFSGILAVMLFSMFIEKSNILAFFGKYSLPMFAAHTFLIYFINDIRFFITGKFYTVASDIPFFQTVWMTIAVSVCMVIIAFLYQKLFIVFHFFRTQLTMEALTEMVMSKIKFLKSRFFGKVS